MRIKIAKWGNSLALRLPRAVVDEAGLSEGQVVEVAARGGVVEARRVNQAPSYRLEDLVAEMKRLGPENEPPLEDWGPDVGAEVIDDDYSRGLIQEPEGATYARRSSRRR